MSNIVIKTVAVDVTEMTLKETSTAVGDAITSFLATEVALGYVVRSVQVVQHDAAFSRYNTESGFIIVFRLEPKAPHHVTIKDAIEHAARVDELGSDEIQELVFEAIDELFDEDGALSSDDMLS